MAFSFKKKSFKGIWRKAIAFWIHHYKPLFALLFLVISGIGGFQWYQDLYRYEWSAEERKAYLESTAKETAFQEEKFLQVLKRLENEAVQHGVEITPGRDLFAGARKKESDR